MIVGFRRGTIHCQVQTHFFPSSILHIFGFSPFISSQTLLSLSAVIAIVRPVDVYCFCLPSIECMRRTIVYAVWQYRCKFMHNFIQNCEFINIPFHSSSSSLLSSSSPLPLHIFIVTMLLYVCMFEIGIWKQIFIHFDAV